MSVRRCHPLLLALGLLLVAGTAAAQSLDRFYLDLLQTGAQELDRGDAAAAARDLRLACFGLLDAPPTLAGCLVRLGIAQAALGDDAAFDETFRRLAEVEERFSGLSRADLPQALRARYVDEALRREKEARLRTIPALGSLLDERQEAELARLSVRERRKAIEAKLAADPESRRWRLALAALELQDQRPKAALKPLDGLLRTTPDDSQALCLRGRAQAALDDCAAALESLGACAATDAAGAAARLGCLLAEHRDGAALDFARTLPPATRADAAVARLLAKLPASPPPATAKPTVIASPAAPAKPAATPAPAPATHVGPVAAPRQAAAPPQPATSPTARPDPSPAPPASPGPDLQQLQRQAEAARTTTDLEEVWKAASALADGQPSNADAQFLAAEVAYRERHWADADRYFRRGGDPGEGRPLLLFYAAVVAHETGDARRAEATLRRALPLIQRTPYVDLYVQKILRSPSGP